jgi:hypothetical protein
VPPAERRWNDQAIDGLAEKVDDISNELVGMRNIPREVAERMVRMETAVAAMLESQREQAKVSREFRKDIHQKIDGVRGEIGHVKSGQDSQPGKAWITIVVAIITVIGVIAAALIAAYVQIKTGRPR